MRIRWLDQALDDLEAVRVFIARDNPTAAAQVARRIRRATKMLTEYPTAGRPGRVLDTRELVVSGTPYILPYRVRGNVLEIVRVLHAARKWPER